METELGVAGVMTDGDGMEGDRGHKRANKAW